MKVNMELDGEPISIEQSSPADRTTGLNVREDFPFFNDSFNNADGMINHADSEGRIRMVAAVAGQNTPNYFDQDNFYPAEGPSKGFFGNVGEAYKNAAKGAAGFLSEEQSKERREARNKRRDIRTAAKAEETKSRADLNREIGKDKASDLELAKALGASDKQPMSTTTKVLIGVGVLAVVGAVAYFVIKKKK
jgi:hypothetical protein